MANILSKVQQYLTNNSKTWDNKKVSLQNDSDGNGDYIKFWDYDIAKPTTEQLNSYESAATTDNVMWAGGSVPAFTDGSAAVATDIVSFYWDADEQQAYGTASLAFAEP